MKHLKKLFAAVLICSSLLASAQNADHPWSVQIGANAVDTRSSSSKEFSKRLGGFFNVGEQWNILPSVSYLKVGRHLVDGLSVNLVGSINKIDKFVETQVEGQKDLVINNPGDLSYYTVGAELKYAFANLYGGTSAVVDPFVAVGLGYGFIGEGKAALLNLGGGINFWFNEFIALTVQSQYNKSFSKDRTPNVGLPSHTQHFAGLTFQFGGKDTDGDGVLDKNDECPEVPGLKEFNGCPDTDGDGIPDHLDECPDLPGTAEFNGCPDTDGDGVPDHKDQCPDVAGPIEFNGCPDTDGDGVPDNLDECPDVPGPVENKGCPYADKDGDGVPDHLDECPDVPGPVENKGCPEIAEEKIKELNEYGKVILFHTGKYTFQESSYKVLDNIVSIMKEYPSAKFKIKGHTDSTGSDKINQPLSENRAAAVKEYLVKNGIDIKRLESAGYGSSQPIESNKTKKGRDLNRRVEVELIK